MPHPRPLRPSILRSACLGIACILGVACGSADGPRGPDPSFTACTLAANVDRSAFAFVNGRALVLLRGDERREMPFRAGTCLERGAELDKDSLVVVLADGWRAIVAGEARAAFGERVACLVDFQTGRASKLVEPFSDLGRRSKVKASEVRGGRTSGRLYSWVGADGPQALEPGSDKVTALDGLAAPATGAGCDLAETAHEVVMACAAQRHSSHGLENYVDVGRMPLEDWPRPIVRTELAVPSRIDHLVLAPDASRVAVWNNRAGEPLHVLALELGGRTIDVDLRGERLDAVAFDRAQLLLGVHPPDTSSASVRIVNAQGEDVATFPVRGPVSAIHPMPGRILVEAGCSMQWLVVPQ